MANESQMGNSKELSLQQEVNLWLTTPESRLYRAELNQKIERVAVHLKEQASHKPRFKNKPMSYWRGLAAGSPNL